MDIEESQVSLLFVIIWLVYNYPMVIEWIIKVWVDLTSDSLRKKINTKINKNIWLSSWFNILFVTITTNTSLLFVHINNLRGKFFLRRDGTKFQFLYLYAFMSSDNLSTPFILKVHNANICHDMYRRKVHTATFSI